MLLKDACIVLHMCATFHDYTYSLKFWSEQKNKLRIFGVDGCSNYTIPVQRLLYQQYYKPTHNRFRISHLERAQMEASLQQLPGNCSFIVKLTGKYMLPALATTIQALPNNTLLALSARGKSYGGYSSELFGVNRLLYKNALAFWTDGRNTESFVSRLHNIVLAIHPNRVMHMPKMILIGHTKRYSDNHLMKYL